MVWVIPVFFYKKVFQPLMVSNINNSTPCSASSDHNPSGPLQLLLTTPSFGQLSAHSLPCRGASCGTAPYPQTILALTHWCWLKEKKSRPLRQPEGGPGPEPAGVGGRASRGGEPINQPVTRSLLGPSPTPNRAWVGTAGSQKRKGRRQASLFCSNYRCEDGAHSFWGSFPQRGNPPSLTGGTSEHCQDRPPRWSWGKGAARVEFWSCICRFRQKTEIVSAVYKKERRQMEIMRRV